jgi:ABC-type dipeptide/oligopeptide/nickel transport system ATPase component
LEFRIQEAVRTILKIENLTVDENKKTINTFLENTVNIQTVQVLNHFDKNVPHWFISRGFQRTVIGIVFILYRKILIVDAFTF